MKKQFLAMLSAVAVAGTVITVPLVSSQAAQKKTPIINNEGGDAIDKYVSYIKIEPNDDKGQQNLVYDNGAIKHLCDCNSESNTNHGIAKDITKALKEAEFKSGDTLSVSVKVASAWYDEPATAFILLDNHKTTLATVSHDGSYDWFEATLTGQEKVTFDTYEKAYFVVTQHCAQVSYSDINLTLIQEDSEEPEQPTATPSEGDWQKVFSTKDKSQNELNEFIQNGTVERYSSTEGSNPSEPSTASNSWGGNFGPCFKSGGEGNQPEGIKIKLDGVQNGDSVKVGLKLYSTYAHETKISLLQGDTLTSLYDGITKSDPYEYDLGPVSITGDGEVYLCIEDCASAFFVDDIEVYKKSGGTEPAKPTLTSDRAEFEMTNGSLDGTLKGARLEDGGHVIKSADGQVVSVWKCVFTGAAPGGLDVTATSGEESRGTTVTVGGTETAIEGSGDVTFYVLVNSDSSDIKFEAKVHVE